MLKVRRLVDKDQAWFWTERWQKGEKEADDDIRAGRVHHFENAESAIECLHGRARKSPAKQAGRAR
ncbi:MAG: hypothetical protein HY673_23260 [Chloroflexi bacterium]|nr:hypothetical protein [Chloroflexota bacterium]